jgi:hypothetical protein
MSRSGYLRISIVGDVFAPSPLITAQNESERLITKNRFLAPFEQSDLVLCNLEAPISLNTGSGKNKKYCLENSLDCLEFFDTRFVLSLANNHIMDYGPKGLRETMDQLEVRGLTYAGVGNNLKEASSPAIVCAGGLTLAILCAVDPRFQSVEEPSLVMCPAYPELLVRIIREAKEQVDCVVLSVHAGMEFTPVPTPFMMNLADQCLAAGAQIINFHHAHCLSGITQKDEKLVIWGTGNYVFPYIIPQGFSPWFESAAWNVTIDQQQKLRKTEIIPVNIDQNGLPGIAQGESAKRIAAKIQKYSSRIDSGRNLGFWRACSVLHPVYVWLALINYVEMAHRTGVKSVLKYVASALRTYWPRKNHDQQNESTYELG